MYLSLIGMSGSGKSSWATRLVAHGFRVFHCDDRIEEKLVSELVRLDGTTMGVGEWMGFPYDPGYYEREAWYLDLEKAVLEEILDIIKGCGNFSDADIVIDTTGSVIYTGEKILSDLRRLTTVIHLETPLKVQEQMLTAYLANRRPVLWRGYFSKKLAETNDAALARCYPKLISDREQLYQQYSDVTLDYASHSDQRWRVDDFLTMVLTRHAK
jgi:shikimate kinase